MKAKKNQLQHALKNVDVSIFLFPTIFPVKFNRHLFFQALLEVILMCFTEALLREANLVPWVGDFWIFLDFNFSILKLLFTP